MSILQKLELAIRDYLLSRIAQDAFLITDQMQFVVTDTGLKIRVRLTGAGTEEIDVPFMVGESEELGVLPSVRIVGQTAIEDFDAHTFFCDVVVLVMYPADSYKEHPDIVAALLAVSDAVCRLLYVDDIADRINHRVDGLTVYGPSARQGARSVDGRTRIHRYGLTLYAANADLFAEPEAFSSAIVGIQTLAH